MTEETKSNESTAPVDTASQDAAQETQSSSPTSVAINDLDLFANIVSAWHGNLMAKLKHILTVPVGMQVQIEDEEPFTLEGPAHKGFLLGMNMAIGEMQNLPFTRREIPETPEPEVPTTDGQSTTH